MASTSIPTTTWRTTTGGTVSTRVDEAPGHVECPPRIVWQRISLDGMDWVGNEGKSSNITTKSAEGQTSEGKKKEFF
jgi:hypothetical protein